MIRRETPGGTKRPADSTFYPAHFSAVREPWSSGPGRIQSAADCIMPKVILRFYEELNDYLPAEKRKKDFEVRFEGRSTVGEILRGQGIPEGEVDLILVNGQSVDFDYVPGDDDRASIYPVFERLDVSGVTRVRSRPLRSLTFVAENGLGETAERLRELGFDVRCVDVREAMEISEREKRVLLTAKAEVAKSGGLSRVLHVAPGSVGDQVRAILRGLSLA